MSARDPIHDHEVCQLVENYTAKPHETAGEDPYNKKFVRAFTSFANTDLPLFLQPLLKSYISWAQQYLADPRDVVFITHIIWSFLVVVPSAMLLLYRWNSTHALIHAVLLVRCIPPYILMLHCICHKKAGNKKGWWVDFAVHYLIGLFHGETLNTFYYHHVKHHHITDNGPLDLSSTIWYDRDNPLHFLIYYLRFYFLVSIELPIHFIRNKKYSWAVGVITGEFGSLLFLASWFAICDWRSVLAAWFLPLNLARIGMMSGNWVQHAFLAQKDATNDYKTAITCINTPYNVNCFNDGYHTSHHLNPIRHWQDHPEHFKKSIQAFDKHQTIIFQKCDYFEIWMRLMINDWKWIGEHYVDLTGKMSHEDKVEWLKARVKKLSPEDMEISYGKNNKKEM